jgi:hypothetical protein
MRPSNSLGTGWGPVALRKLQRMPCTAREKSAWPKADFRYSATSCTPPFSQPPNHPPSPIMTTGRDDRFARHAVWSIACPDCFRKFLAFLSGKITSMSGPSRPDERGVRVVTDVGCGMRWTRRCVRRTRRSRTAKPCGPDAPTLAFKLATMLAHHESDVAFASR